MATLTVPLHLLLTFNSSLLTDLIKLYLKKALIIKKSVLLYSLYKRLNRFQITIMLKSNSYIKTIAIC